MGQGGIVRSSTQKIAGQDATMHRAVLRKGGTSNGRRCREFETAEPSDRRWKGIGRATAQLLAGRGAKVLAKSRTSQPVAVSGVRVLCWQKGYFDARSAARASGTPIIAGGLQAPEQRCPPEWLNSLSGYHASD
jgi:NAD(P)-dependent dehydrogenase (short-subunit alcohol dehydrogenase family)